MSSSAALTFSCSKFRPPLNQRRVSSLYAKRAMLHSIALASQGTDDSALHEAAKLTVWRRPSIGHADPLGVEVDENLDQINGVVEHGVVYGIPCSAVIASQTGVQLFENMPMNFSSDP